MSSFDRIRPLLAPWGSLKPQSAADWDNPFALPAVIAEFYQEIGPWGDVYNAAYGPVGLAITIGGNPIEVPTLRELWSRQDGSALLRRTASQATA